jgi:hypothetical protein
LLATENAKTTESIEEFINMITGATEDTKSTLKITTIRGEIENLVTKGIEEMV